MSGWAPKEFTEGEDAEAQPAAAQQPQQEGTSTVNGTDTAATAGGSSEQVGAASSAAQPSGTSGYIYDEASGYFYDPGGFTCLCVCCT